MARWCWVNLQCQGVLLTCIIVGQGPTALAVGAGGGCLDIFSLVYHFPFPSPSLWETTRYRLKYCLKGPLNQKQLTNHVVRVIEHLCDRPTRTVDKWQYRRMFQKTSCRYGRLLSLIHLKTYFSLKDHV